MSPKEIAADFTKALAESGNGRVWAFVEAYMEKAIIAGVKESAKICDLEAEQRRARAADAEGRGNLHVAEEYKLLADHSVMLAERIREAA